MSPEPESAEEVDYSSLSPDDQLSLLACAAIDLLCNGFNMSRDQAKIAFSAQLDELHPYVAVPVLGRVH